MNTTTTSTSTTRLALGTAIAALCFGAAACGSEQAADPAGSIKQGSQQSQISPRPAENHAEQCRREGHPTYGSDSCTSTASSETRSAAHSSGSQKYPDLLP